MVIKRLLKQEGQMSLVGRTGRLRRGESGHSSPGLPVERNPSQTRFPGAVLVAFLACDG